MKKTKKGFVIPVFALAVTLVLFRFVLFVGYVPTESMEPTLHKGSFIFGSRIFSELEVGDIIVFQHERKLEVKRIAAAEGTVVQWQNSQLTVPAGHYYVLGDNAANSRDSRYWTEPFVSLESVMAKIFQ